MTDYRITFDSGESVVIGTVVKGDGAGGVKWVAYAPAFKWLGQGESAEGPEQAVEDYLSQFGTAIKKAAGKGPDAISGAGWSGERRGRG